MKTARKFAFALIMVMSFVMSPVLASANSGDQDPAAHCSTLEECQAMVAQYEELYGPLPAESDSAMEALPLSVQIEMTPGVEELPADVQSTIDGYMADLQVFTEFVCTDEQTQFDIWNRMETFDVPQEEVFASIEATDQATIDAAGLDLKAWSDVSAALNDYLQEQAAAGYSVPSRAPTLLELAEQYPGCSTGEVYDWE